MPTDAAIYLETRPATAPGGPAAVLVFRSAAGGIDWIGGKPVAGGPVRRRRLPVDPAAAPRLWQAMKRDAEATLQANGPRAPRAPIAAVTAALAAAGFEPDALIGAAPPAGAGGGLMLPHVPDVADTAPLRPPLADVLAGDGPDPLEAVLVKRPEAASEDEVRRVMQARIDLPPGDPRRQRLYAFERRHFDHVYGAGAAPSGNALEDAAEAWPHEPAQEPPVAADPQTTRDGEPLAAALERTVVPLARAAEAGDPAEVVRGAQAGLNLLEEPEAGGRRLLDAPLKLDGEAGPKTRAALTRAVALLGAGRVAEAIALGRLRRAADAAAAGRRAVRLAQVTRESVTPLFHDPRVRGAPAVENEVVQEALNALGTEPRLAIDGALGPKTEAAFRSAACRCGPDRLTAALADALGFGA